MMIKYSKRFNKLIIRALIWLALVVFVIVIAYFIPDVNSALTSTYIAKYDSVFVSGKYECYFVKNEKLTKAKNGGTVSYQIEEGEHVRTNDMILKVGKKSYTAQQAGLVSFSSDGYETYFTEDNLAKITHKDAKSSHPDNKNLVRTEAEKGDVVFKTVDDKRWFMIFWVGENELNLFAKNKTVDVIFDSDNRVEATVFDVLEQDKEYMVVLKSIEYYPQMATARKAKPEIISINQDGLVIKQKSIVTDGDKQGVYVKQINGDYEYVRVKVYSTFEDKAIVASGTFTEMVDGQMYTVSTINSYDEILKNAKGMDKGGE